MLYKSTKIMPRMAEKFSEEEIPSLSELSDDDMDRFFTEDSLVDMHARVDSLSKRTSGMGPEEEKVFAEILSRYKPYLDILGGSVYEMIDDDIMPSSTKKKEPEKCTAPIIEKVQIMEPEDEWVEL